MVEPIAIITLVASIVMPVITVIAGSVAYALRKIKKSSCMNCFTFESDEKSPKLDELTK